VSDTSEILLSISILAKRDLPSLSLARSSAEGADQAPASLTASHNKCL
jgi:hypothetical protein